MTTEVIIREAQPDEFKAAGQLMVEVYSQLEGFPGKNDFGDYYEMLANVGDFTEKPGTKIVVALSPDDELCGAVVYFANMQDYSSGGDEINIDKASGIRLLSVHNDARGRGVGKSLTNACIQLAKDAGHTQVILHSTEFMKIAWAMYEKIGFNRFEELDFELHGFSIFGFRLEI